MSTPAAEPDAGNEDSGWQFCLAQLRHVRVAGPYRAEISEPVPFSRAGDQLVIYRRDISPETAEFTRSYTRSDYGARPFEDANTWLATRSAGSCTGPLPAISAAHPKLAVDLGSRDGRAIYHLFARVKETEDADGSWPGGDIAVILTGWFTGCGFDIDAAAPVLPGPATADPAT
jgi:hypothetical protein